MGSKSNVKTENDLDKKIRQVEEIFIEGKHHEEILREIEICRDRSRFSKEPRCMLLLGLQGVGKTTTIDFYLEKHTRSETSDGAKVPVISVQIDAPANVKSLVSEILSELGDPFAEMGSITSQTHRLRKLLKACGTELLIFDEFQHFLDCDSPRVLKGVSDWLKGLLNKTNIPIVMCGMPYSKGVLDARNNEQLRDRFQKRIYIEPFKWGTDDDIEAFRTFLGKVDSELPLNHSGLGGKTMAFRIYCASNGYPRHVMYLIRSAALLALERGLPKIDLPLLEEAYEDRYRNEYPHRQNPFNVAVSDLEIVPFDEAEPELKNLQQYLNRETASDVIKK